MKKRTKIILIIWCFLILLLVLLTFTFTSTDKVSSPIYDKMIEASELAKEAMDGIKQYKIENGIEISEEDFLQTGMIGSGKKTTITSTEGVLEAKRTTCNPEWAGLIVKVFAQNGIKEGDQVAMVFSGSFPALNICIMAACQTMNIDTCIMASIGASYYGANQIDCTFLDMSVYLYNQGIFNKKIDYISMGGADDIGYNFRKEDEVNEIKKRINNSGVTFLYEEDYKKNIDNRLDIILEKTPNCKLFINCGGTVVSFGNGLNTFTESGYFNGNKRSATLNEVKNRKNENEGLIQCIRKLGIDVFSLKTIKDLSEIYGLPYDPSSMPEIGSSDCFYKNKYSYAFPIIGIVLSLIFGVYFYLERKEKIDGLIEKFKK